MTTPAFDRPRLRAVRDRWAKDRKISGRDVEWLLTEVDQMATRESVADTRRTRSFLDDLLGRGTA